MKTEYIDTYSNLKKAKPIFYRKDGRLTAYALHCGYVQKYKTHEGELQLYCEHLAYHVKFFPTCEDCHFGLDYKNGSWEVFDTLNEAWEQYNKFKMRMG